MPYDEVHRDNGEGDGQRRHTDGTDLGLRLAGNILVKIENAASSTSVCPACVMRAVVASLLGYHWTNIGKDGTRPANFDELTTREMDAIFSVSKHFANKFFEHNEGSPESGN